MDSGERVSSSRNPSRYPLYYAHRHSIYACLSCTQEAARKGSLATLDETRKAEDQPRVAEGQRLQTGQA